MDTEARLSGFGLSLLGGLLAIVVAFAGSASIGDRTGPARIAPLDPKAISQQMAGDPPAQVNASNPASASAPPNTAPRGGAARTKEHCAGCGVVESVRRIERRDTAPGVCDAMDSEPFWMHGNARHGTADGGVGPLSSFGDGTFAGQPDARRTLVKSTYQIVVRFRDGSRHVFNEATPRTLRLGERIQVIAGADFAPNERRLAGELQRSADL
jgi:hypothetical protein